MKTTTKLGLHKPELSDEVQDTILKIAQDMQTIDDKYNETVANLESTLQGGVVYNVGKRFWNSASYLGGYAGWVNVRTGVHAQKWEPQTMYAVGNIVKPTIDNGHYYECIAAGTTSTNEPLFDPVTDSVTIDVRGNSRWEPNHHYRLGDIVVSVGGDLTFWFKCTTEGFSGTTEPAWDRAEGRVTNDGTAAFTAYRTVRWREKGISCDFVRFGYIGYSTRKFTQSIGDGLTNTIIVKHNLNTLDVVALVRLNAAPYTVPNVGIEIVDENNIKLTFQTIPTLDQYRITVIG